LVACETELKQALLASRSRTAPSSQGRGGGWTRRRHGIVDGARNAEEWRLLFLSREPLFTRIVNLHYVRRDTLVVDDESIADSKPLEECLRQRNQRAHLTAINGGGADDFGHQSAA